MKKVILFSVFIAMMGIASFSQSIGDLPATTIIIHYRLSIGYNTTTILIFPSAVQQVDRGERDLMAQKQAGVENVLKVKAARKDFQPTNLHVFTADGHVYAFDIEYVPNPLQTTYDLTRLTTTDSAESNSKGLIVLSGKPFDTQKIANDIAKIKNEKPFFSHRNRKFQMELRLQTIYRSDNILFIGFKIINRSNLPYDVDFAQLYIQDKRQLKRASTQQREITPIYRDSISCIPGKSAVEWVVAIPRLTVPEHRQFALEIYEKNGGRHIRLEVANRQLFKAKEL